MNVVTNNKWIGQSTIRPDGVDKVTGRAKQAAGAVTGSKSTEQQGRKEERKADKKEEAAQAQEQADQKQKEASRLESQT